MAKEKNLCLKCVHNRHKGYRITQYCNKLKTVDAALKDTRIKSTRGVRGSTSIVVWCNKHKGA